MLQNKPHHMFTSFFQSWKVWHTHTYCVEWCAYKTNNYSTIMLI
jgi:hypothetical protein